MSHKLSARTATLIAGLAMTTAAASGQSFDWAAAVDGNWNDTTKWNPNGFPDGVGNNATIDATGAAYTVTVNINATLDNLLLDSLDATLFFSGRTLSILNTAVFNQGNVLFRSGGLAGGGTGTNRDTAEVNGTTSFDLASFLNEGDFTVAGVPGLSAALNLGTTSFTNDGSFTMTSTSNGNSTLQSAATFTNNGTFSVLQGSGTVRTISVLDFDNNGDLNVSANTTFNGLNGVTTTGAAGSFNTASGFTATFNNGHDFELSGGTVDNQGGLLIDGANATFIFNGGTLTGNAPVIRNANLVTTGAGTGTIDVTGSSTLLSNVAGGLNINILGAPGLSAQLDFGAVDFSSNATINMDSTSNGNATFRGTGTFTNDGTFNVLQGSGTVRTVNVPDFDNNGDLNVSANTTFNGASGVTTTGAAGSFNTASGFAATFNNGHDFELNGGMVDNQGGLLIDGANATFIFNGGTLTGNAPVIRNANLVTTGAGTGTIDVTGSSTLLSNVAGGLNINILGAPGLSAQLDFGAVNFSSAATINMDSTSNGNSSFIGAGTFTNDGVFNVLEGSGTVRTVSVLDFDNNGDLNISANTTFNGFNGTTTTSATGSFDVAPGFSASFNNGHDFELDGGTVNNNANLLIDGGNSTLIFNGGTLNGNAVQIRNANLVTTGAGTGTILATGNSTLLSNVAGGLNIDIMGVPGLSAQLDFGAVDFSSDATINMDSTSNGNSTFRGTGTFTNDGTLHSKAGSGTVRTITISQLVNSSMLQIDANTLFNAGGGNTIVTGTGTMGVGNGFTATFNSGNDLEVDGGVVNNQGAIVVGGGGAELRLNNATLNGNAVQVRNGALSTTGAGSGTVRVEGTTQLLSDLAPGHTIDISGVAGLNATLNYASSDRVNNAVINMNSVSSGASSINGTGVFTNANTINVFVGSGTGRTITTGGFVNDGDFNAMGDVRVNVNSSTFLNSGELFIAPDAVVTISGSGAQTFDNDDNGIVSGDGTLDLRNVETFINDGVFDPQGSLNVLGDWDQSTNGDLAIAIGGTTMGTTYDVLAISLDATLLGDLELTLANSFTPAASDVFTILTARDVTGMFENAFMTVQTSDGLGTFDVLYNADSVQLTNFVPVPTPASAALLGAAGLFATRRRRA